MNKWGIPEWLEIKIRNGDTKCVFCGKNFAPNSKDKATWEHLDNVVSNITEENICLC